MTASLQRQQALLRQASEPRLQRQMQIGCLSVLVAVALAVAVWAIGTREWGGLFAALVLVLMGLGIRHSSQEVAPHIARAREALTQFEAVEGRVRVVATSDDGNTTYEAGVQDREGRDWTFRFSSFDWRPPTGDYPAQLRYVSEVAWPVLILTEAGLICPLHRPKQALLTLPPDDVPPTRQSVRAGWIAATVFLVVGALVVLGAWGSTLDDSGTAVLFLVIGLVFFAVGGSLGVGAWRAGRRL